VNKRGFWLMPFSMPRAVLMGSAVTLLGSAVAMTVMLIRERNMPALLGYLGWALIGAVLLAGGLLVAVAYIEAFTEAAEKRRVGAERIGRALAGFSVRSLAGVAAWLAGRKRLALRDEWRAHLAGESGRDSVAWRNIRQALGCVAAAVQLRLGDAADLAWRPADAVLGSRTLSNLFVGGPVIVVLFAIVHHDGRFGLVTDIQDAGELGVFLYGVVRLGRWWRQIKQPEPKPRRAKE
jgi:hypothetical protein